jgi:4-amino-4-deoxy-L-arabinose transferase-like glycosyltransferase
MLALLRYDKKHIIAALLTGLLLRLWFIHYYPALEGDPLIYGEIARNWFWHGCYCVHSAKGLHPTLIRLPGYPLFLGMGFLLFGVDQFGKILWLQAGIDLITCLLLAGFAARTISRRAGIAVLYLAALCPFTSNFTASPLTETPTLFCIALGLYALSHYREHPTWNGWFWTLVFSISYAALLRPDGALLGAVLVPAMFWYGREKITARASAILATACVCISLVPFLAWTLRNARTFHTFQPLAPRYANNPGEFVPHGWIRWVKSWSVDYTSTEEIYWSVNGAPLDITALPTRAMDTPQEAAETTNLFAQYNKTNIMTPALDNAFGQLAARRIHRNPLRYYIALPVARLADMWLRPRVGQLPISLRWWQYSQYPAMTIFSWAYAALNLAYLLLAAWGLRQRVPFAAVMVWYVVLRCALLLTLETPESRYTLECFPIVIVLAGTAIAAWFSGPRNGAAISQSPASSRLF